MPGATMSGLMRPSSVGPMELNIAKLSNRSAQRCMQLLVVFIKEMRIVLRVHVLWRTCPIH